VTSRRAFVATLLALPLAGRAQPARTYRVGYLLLTPLVQPPSPERAAFLAELRKLGYEEGRNLHMEYRSADGALDRLLPLAEDLVRGKVDVIVATATPPAVAAAKATRTVPVVFIGIADAERTRLVTNLARPEANLTGVTWLTFETVSKRFQLLKETLPRAVRVALLWNPADRGAVEQRPLASDAAARLRLALDDYLVGDVQQLQAALERLARERPHALFVVPDARIITYRKIIADEALKQRIACFASYRGFADAGALMSYAADLPDLYRRGANFVARVLRGAKPADLPVEQPTRFELVLNLKTARALKVSIPHSVMVLADKVIK
jgi:putative ABC transport system substrate-binding protein